MNRREARVALTLLLAAVLTTVAFWTLGGDRTDPAPAAPAQGGRMRPVAADLVASGSAGPTGARLAEGSRAIGRRPAGDPRSRSAVTPPVMLPDAARPSVFLVDQAGITAAVAAHRQALQRCYETARFHTPGLGGRLVLALALEPAEGAPLAEVASVDVEGDLDTSVLEGCAAEVFEGVTFAATEPVTLRAPVDFEAPAP